MQGDIRLYGRLCKIEEEGGIYIESTRKGNIKCIIAEYLSDNIDSFFGKNVVIKGVAGWDIETMNVEYVEVVQVEEFSPESPSELFKHLRKSSLGRYDKDRRSSQIHKPETWKRIG